MTDNAKPIECPRCGENNTIEINPSKSSLKEYECVGKCAGDTLDHRYFQYETMDDTYSWPAVGVMYKCHKDELLDVRKGKIRPEFV